MRQCKISDYYRTDISESLIKRIGIESFYCPKNTTYRVLGDSLDELSTFINIKINLCNSKLKPDECKTDQEI